ncbi:MAG: DUF4105 domain-containing protein [Pseudomonadales bacterium]|nr:DUF4105 domain-containing protein [Pseudomonadales bacterium]
MHLKGKISWAFLFSVFGVFLTAPTVSYGQGIPVTIDASTLVENIRFYNPISGRPINIGKISDKTVTGFELLYATPGTGDISEVAGHLMLRIKLNNNPEAEANHEENPNDLVISFLADTREFQSINSAAITPKQQCQKNWFNLVDGNQQDLHPMHSIVQSLKGLTGGLDTRMDVQSLAYTLKVYTIEEDRNLLRYRLNLSPQQKINLLEHLAFLTHHHKADYYFFSQNCASILVSVLGKGIKNEEIARFHPIISAPNSLVALLVRRGLAEPVTPGFYSYRKKGYLAKKILQQKISQLEEAHPTLNWPDASALKSTHIAKRKKVIQNIAHLYQNNPTLYQQTYELATWVQEAELAYSHKDLVCELYTSEISAEAREFQQQILHNLSANRSNTDFIKHVKKDEAIKNLGGLLERADYSSGIPYTKLLSYSLGFNRYHTYKESKIGTHENQKTNLNFDGVLFHQEMGSPSSLAMQRTSRVTLGRLSIDINASDETLKLNSFTVLKLSKFRDQLGKTSGFWHGTSSIGFGLSLLDIHHHENEKMTNGRIAGAELLYGLLSSGFNEHYLYAASGINWDWQKLPTEDKTTFHTNTGVRPLAGIYSLITLNKKRKIQVRNQIEFSPGLGQGLSRQLSANAKINYRIGRYQQHLIYLNIFAEYQRHDFNTTALTDFSESKIGISVEINSF